MKPAPFDYVRAFSVDEALAALTEAGGDAKIMAGGQSLVPMLNFRLIDASTFIDINEIESLSGIQETGDGGLRVGALTRHFALETSDLVRWRFPVLQEAMKYVAHLAIRNRGTIGGSLSHADPAAELPTISVLLDAEIETANPAGGRRIMAQEFFIAPLTTVLEPDEIVVAVHFPGLPDGAGWGFEEVSQRHGDFAVAGAAAIVVRNGESVAKVNIALMGVHDTPLRAVAAERAMMTDGIEAAAIAAQREVDPTDDLHGSADYRRHLVGVLTRRTLMAAFEGAQP
jgi:carbon-monoxide dehydrogenase medium subunit